MNLVPLNLVQTVHRIEHKQTNKQKIYLEQRMRCAILSAKLLKIIMTFFEELRYFPGLLLLEIEKTIQLVQSVLHRVPIAFRGKNKGGNTSTGKRKASLFKPLSLEVG